MASKKRRSPNRSATRTVRVPVRPSSIVSADPWAQAALASGMPVDEVETAARLRHPDAALVDVAERLRAVELQRLALLSERSELVDRLRAEGWSWNRLAAAAGVSRQALIDAHGRGRG